MLSEDEDKYEIILSHDILRPVDTSSEAQNLLNQIIPLKRKRIVCFVSSRNGKFLGFKPYYD